MDFKTLSAGPKKTLAAPGDDPEAKVKKHVPVIEKADGRIKVTVAHGMAEDHWIQAIWVQTESGEMLKSVELTASDSPCLEMDAPPSGKIVAYEICNLHGVYASEPTEI